MRTDFQHRRTDGIRPPIFDSAEKPIADGEAAVPPVGKLAEIAHSWEGPRPRGPSFPSFSAESISEFRPQRSALCPTLKCALFGVLLQGSPLLAAPDTHYVNPNNSSPVSNYTSWATASTNIQLAINAAASGDTVLVTNGTYATGGTVVYGGMTNRVAITKAIVVKSVNGPSVTLIKGTSPSASNAVRCVYLGTNAFLAGFTLTNGATRTSGDMARELSGGGAWCDSGAIISNCVVTGNSASSGGGGAYGGSLYDCTVHRNACGAYGGGASSATLDHCIVTGNTSTTGGGGVTSSRLLNCLIYGNTSSFEGGGAFSSWMANCTIVSNAIGDYAGGGIRFGAATNCIVYFNTANTNMTTTPDVDGAAMVFSCYPSATGVGNITNNPLFADVAATNLRLQLASPCIGAGTNVAWMSAATDLDGNPRILNGKVDMGAYEQTFIAIYVCTNGNDSLAGTNWVTAKATLQAGVDAVANYGTVWVSNGVYASGGRPVVGSMTNRIAIDKPVTVRSVNGAGVTIVKGAGPNGNAAVRCAYVGANAALIGFTLTNGFTRATGSDQTQISGGGSWGAWPSTVADCILSGNTAYNLGGGAYGGILSNCIVSGNVGYYGGGASWSELHSCLIRDNRATYGGGGAQECWVYNCTISSNASTSYYGGGTYRGTMANSIVYFNTAALGSNNWGGGTWSYSCTIPLPSAGAGNITNDPNFVNVAGNDLRLQAWSPCVNAGSDQTSPPGTYDLDGNPRILDGRVDMGAYEFAPRDVYVRASGSDTAAGTNWATAKLTIQAGVDRVAVNGTVWVSNGVYAAGGRPVYGAMTNRVAIDKPVTVRSANGTNVTFIVGLGAAGAPGDSVARCVYLTNHAVLIGFTLSNGFTRAAGDGDREQSGGGAWCEPGGVLDECLITACQAYKGGGGCYGGTLTGCALSRNTVVANNGTGGGVCNAALFDSAVCSNTIVGQYGQGAGAWGSLLYNCRIAGNAATNRYSDGGGTWGCALGECELSANSASAYFGTGGGAEGGTATNCTFSYNYAYKGGGADSALLRNCALTANKAGEAGGAYMSTLYNCTVTRNSALYGGGTSLGSAYNCILYFNTADVEGPNYFNGSQSYCCTTPEPSGLGHIVSDPALADSIHLSSASPCVRKGSSAYARGVDMDGDVWLSPPSIGCDESTTGLIAGPLTVAIVAEFTNVAVGCAVDFTAVIDGRTTGSRWSFGGGHAYVWNTPFLSRSWSASGTQTVTLTAYNETYPAGVSTSMSVRVVSQPVHYVNGGGTFPAIAPYTNWTTAARTIQEAIDAVSVAGSLVLVTNGVYATGGRMMGGGPPTNRVVLDRYVVVRSVNGPSVTTILGSGPPPDIPATRCAYVGQNATLAGFTLTNGLIRNGSGLANVESGGGVYGEIDATISNCVITGNYGYNGGGAYGGTFLKCTFAGNRCDYGGGATRFATLNNCVLTDNTAGHEGGAVAQSQLKNCLLTGNVSGDEGGGAYYSVLSKSTVIGNSAATNGGGVSSGCTLENCIVYDNTAPSGSNYFDRCSFAYSCTTPNPGGAGNMTNAPQIVSAATRNYRLSAGSPCIDAGITAKASIQETDLDGRPRVVRGLVDIGAYEFHFDANLKVLLQGPYRTNLAGMVSGGAVALPSSAPYALDRRAGTTADTNVTDWVLVQVRSSPSNAPLCSRSAYVRGDGTVVDPGGNTNLLLEVPPRTTNYLVVSHRNHLAVMSAQPLVFTNQTLSYDFTANSGRYYGGTSGCVRVAPTSLKWSMIAGDVDGDGEVLDADCIVLQSQAAQTGYRRGDTDLDGLVTTNDLALWATNATRKSAVPNPETLLTPALTVNPSRKTVLSGTTVQVNLSGGVTVSGNWTFVKSVPGSSLTPLTFTSAVYQAGTTQGADIVEAWDTTGKLIRATFNVLDAAAVAGIGKAMVIAGRKSEDDPLWPTTDYLAAFGYNTLLYRGFSKENLLYLSPETNEDADANGLLDDIDLETTFTNVASAFTNWANAPGPLFLYLVDHGGDSSGAGYFRLNASETLTATQLDLWLDAIQNRYSNDVTVVLDCCQSGSFLDELAYTGAARRVVIAACASNEPTYFVAGGMVSFSQAFFGAIMMGLDLRDAFVLAQEAMATYQSSCLDGDRNGRYETGPDELSVTNLYVGPTGISGGNLPQINQVLGLQTLDGDSSVTLWAYDISTPYPPITRVWCLIVPPGHTPAPSQPVGDLTELDLAYNPDTSQYEGEYGGFTKTGLYTVVYYAKDSYGGVSPPQQSHILQKGYDERVILVAAGEQTDPQYATVSNLAALAYHTFRSRWLDTNSIYFLSASTNQDADGDGANDVAGFPTLTNLYQAISGWAGSSNWGGPANKLTVYLIGDATNGLLRMNATEDLDAHALDGWIDGYQRSNRQVNVVLDFPGSGWFIPALTAFPTQTQQRVCIASARSNQVAWLGGGTASFSQFFLSGVFMGQDIGSAYATARTAIRRATGRGRQIAQLDDDGDGESTKIDGVLARQCYIGAAFVTGADSPTIGAVMPDATLNGTSTLTLWVADVSDMAGISNVICTITPPGYDGTGALYRTNLAWNAASNRYETTYSAFVGGGSYVCTFQAVNNRGYVSSPVQALVGTPDSYEPDDSPATARAIALEDIQLHNFHAPSDIDCVRFYVPSGAVYEIDAEQLYSNADLRLDVWYQYPDGSWTNFAWMTADDVGTGTVIEIADVDLKSYPDLPVGFYYLLVSPTNKAFYGAGSDYELQVFSTEAGEGLVVVAVDVLNSALPPTGSVAVINGFTTQTFGTVSSFLTNLPPGTHSIAVPTVPGYVPLWDLDAPGQQANPASYWFGNPKSVAVAAGQYNVAIFQFMPVFQANGLVRDNLTNGIPGASLSFTARDGVLSNTVYDGFPGQASYRSNWVTTADGSFPTNVCLPAGNWNLTIARPGYPDLVITGALMNIPRGATTNMGNFTLIPNLTTNGVPEWWLIRHGWTNNFATAALADTDGDGAAAWQEWVSDTDPTHYASALKVLSLARQTNGMRVAWHGGTSVWQYVERSRALIGTAAQWVAIFTNSPPTLTATNTLDLGETNAPLYYRIKAER